MSFWESLIIIIVFYLDVLLFTILHPLLKAKHRVFSWTTEADTAFKQIKDLLAQATLLNHPTSEAPISIMTDASNVAVGAVLQQFTDNIWKPISYFSRTLTTTERRYSTFDRELLAIYLAIRHFRHFVEGRNFHIVTDH